MRIEIEANTGNHVGLALILSQSDVDRLIKQLEGLKKQPGQHFHLSTDGSENVYVDLAICEDTAHIPNAVGFGLAIDPT